MYNVRNRIRCWLSLLAWLGILVVRQAGSLFSIVAILSCLTLGRFVFRCKLPSSDLFLPLLFLSLYEQVSLPSCVAHTISTKMLPSARYFSVMANSAFVPQSTFLHLPVYPVSVHLVALRHQVQTVCALHTVISNIYIRTPSMRLSHTFCWALRFHGNFLHEGLPHV